MEQMHRTVRCAMSSYECCNLCRCQRLSRTTGVTVGTVDVATTLKWDLLVANVIVDMRLMISVVGKQTAFFLSFFSLPPRLLSLDFHKVISAYEQTVDCSMDEVISQGSTVVIGCMEATANNYHPGANVDSGECTFAPPPTGELSVEGCMVQSALNFNPDANVNSGCVYPILGCMDVTATNYVAAAQLQPDGACMYPVKARFVLKIEGNMTGNTTFATSFKRDLARRLMVPLAQITNLTISYVSCDKVDACTRNTIGRRRLQTSAAVEYVTVTDFQIHHTAATQGAVTEKWNALIFDIAIGTTAISFGGAGIGSADYGEAAQSDLQMAEPEPEPEPDVADLGDFVAARAIYERSAASQVLFTAPSGAKEPETPTTPYQLYHRVVGGILVRQYFSKRVR